MTTIRFRELIGAILTDYFHPTQPQSTERAQQWQRVPNPPIRHLERQVDYQAGQYARAYHADLTQAIQVAMRPNISAIPTSHLQPLEKESTSNPITQSLILWPDDDDVTEQRPVVRPQPTMNKETTEIPAITGEILLMEIMRGTSATHEQTTGENEQLASLP